MNTVEQAFEKAKELVGAKMGGSFEEIEKMINGKMYPVSIHKLDKVHRAEILKNLNYDEHKVRFILIGYMYTQDIRQDRLNIKVDKDMNITNVYIG